MQCTAGRNLGAPLLGGGFVTGRREKLCSYDYRIACNSGRARDKIRAAMRLFGQIWKHTVPVLRKG